MGRKRGRHRRRKDRTLPLGTAVIAASAIVGVYLTASSEGASAVSTSVYVAPGGSDSAPGTFAEPYRTLGKAFSAAERGTTIEVRGGTYRPTRTLRSSVNGTADERIRIRPYRSEKVRVDGSHLPVGSPLVSLSADYWTISGLDLHDAPAGGLVCTSCSGIVLKDLAAHDNGDSGVILRGAGSDHNLVRDVDSYANHDDSTGGSRADGIALTHGSGRDNRIVGARVFNNSDDGMDLWNWAGPVVIDHSWAYGNGRNRWRIPHFTGAGSGFQLGGGSPAAPAAGHVVRTSVAWDNSKHGFDADGNSGAVRLDRTTAYANEGSGYVFPAPAARLDGNLALGNGDSPRVANSAASHGNSWNPGVRMPRLTTTDPARLPGVRLPDGGLPMTTFLLVADGSAIGAPMDRP